MLISNKITADINQQLFILRRLYLHLIKSFKILKVMKSLKISILLLIFLMIGIDSYGCTIAVVSGKYTKNGRPLLWKNRETNYLNNQIMYFTDGKYVYMGLVNSGDIHGKNVWIGHNSAGFAIMNSASYNLNIGDSTKQSGMEGRIIKQALATCAILSDFEALLNKLPIPTKLEANFGVIDANGGAAIYELSNKGFVKFDANDPKVAPFGYIIRGNYSFTGSFGDESSGYIRYNTVNDQFYQAMSTNSFDARFILQKVSRGLYNSLTKEDLYQKYRTVPENTPTYTFFHDFIPRRLTASACVVEGVKKGEDPQYSTLWSVVGFPLTSVVIPTWIKGGKDFPAILKHDDLFKDSPVCHAALSLKKQFFPIRWGRYAMRFYVNINALINADKTGIRQKIEPYENKIFKETNQKLGKWRNEGMKKSQIKAYYDHLNGTIIKMFKDEFDIDISAK